MNPERWVQLERLYHAALDQEPDERPAFLAAACEGDEELRVEVESLLTQSVPTVALKEWELIAEHVGTHTVPTGGARLGLYHIVGPLGEGELSNTR